MQGCRITSPLLGGDTLGASLAHLACASPDSVAAFPSAGDAITAGDLDVASTGAARAFLDAGIEPGDVVGLLVPTAARFLTTVFGLWRAGAAISVLPVQAGFGDEGATARRLARIIDAAGMRHVVLDDAYASLGTELLAQYNKTRQLTLVPPAPAAASASSRTLPTVEESSLAIVQFTSGSTSAPKGVMLPHHTAMAGLRACVVSGEFSPDDVLVQWVPTFHDMGLIGLQSHWLNGADVHVFTPTSFLRRPAAVLEYFAEHKGTVITGPNFSYDHILDAISEDRLSALDLSSWRLAFNGAEPVSAETVRRFSETLAVCGVRPSAMYPVYGMAEATLSITYPRPGDVPRVHSIDRGELTTSGTALAVDEDSPAAKQVVSVGRPVHGVRLRIVDDNGEAAPEAKLGEIQIAGAPVTPGYYRNGPATKALFDGSWLRTGDLGFVTDGELYVTGRRKEMVVVRGQNFFPDDVEAVARTVPGVYRQRCVAFADADDQGSEHIGVIVETSGKDSHPERVRAEVARRVATELDFAQVQVYMVKPRWLPRTTSGKWQRVLAAHRVTTAGTDGVLSPAGTDHQDEGERV